MTMSSDEFVGWLDKELEPLRREASASPYFETWCSGRLTKDQLFDLMKQRYAYLRGILPSSRHGSRRVPIRMCGSVTDYLQEEAPHPDLVDFAREIGRDPQEMYEAELIPEFTTPYYYYWLSRGHIVEIAAANNFGNERTNTRTGKRMHDATVEHYPYPSLIKFFQEHSEEEGGHADLGAYVLRRYATTGELQKKATMAAKKSLQLKIIGTNAIYERFVEKRPKQ